MSGVQTKWVVFVAALSALVGGMFGIFVGRIDREQYRIAAPRQVPTKMMPDPTQEITITDPTGRAYKIVPHAIHVDGAEMWIHQRDPNRGSWKIQFNESRMLITGTGKGEQDDAGNWLNTDGW